MVTEPKAKTCCHLKGKLFKGNVHEVLRYSSFKYKKYVMFLLQFFRRTKNRLMRQSLTA